MKNDGKNKKEKILFYVRKRARKRATKRARKRARRRPRKRLELGFRGLGTTRRIVIDGSINKNSNKQLEIKMLTILSKSKTERWSQRLIIGGV